MKDVVNKLVMLKILRDFFPFVQANNENDFNDYGNENAAVLQPPPEYKSNYQILFYNPWPNSKISYLIVIEQIMVTERKAKKESVVRKAHQVIQLEVGF